MMERPFTTITQQIAATLLSVDGYIYTAKYKQYTYLSEYTEMEMLPSWKKK